MPEFRMRKAAASRRKRSSDQTFPVWVVAFDQDNSHVSTAVSLMALVVTWGLLLLISILDRRRVGAARHPGAF